MSTSKKKCSGCKHFQRLHRFALCTLMDGLTKSDGYCNLWKGKKYKRLTNKETNNVY